MTKPLKIITLLILLVSFSSLSAFNERYLLKQSHSFNVVFIVLDGVRGQEIFHGNYRGRKKYRNFNRYQSRAHYMPFIWKELARQNTRFIGREFSSRAAQCHTNNNAHLSLPGYADLIAGARQHSVLNNSFKGHVEIPTIFDKVIASDLNRDELAVFTSWERISKVLTKSNRTTFHSETGYNRKEPKPPWPEARYDSLLVRSVLDYVERPQKNLRFLFVALNDSDEIAHRRNYGGYLNSIKRQDNYIRQIYQTLESKRHYSKRTVYIITTDHGRGIGKNWTRHGDQKESKNIWAIVHWPKNIEKQIPIQKWFTDLRSDCNHANLGNFARNIVQIPYKKTAQYRWQYLTKKFSRRS